eukprot:3596819-Ditylum_brightwellii.AAC.1
METIIRRIKNRSIISKKEGTGKGMETKENGARIVVFPTLPHAPKMGHIIQAGSANTTLSKNLPKKEKANRANIQAGKSSKVNEKEEDIRGQEVHHRQEENSTLGTVIIALIQRRIGPKIKEIRGRVFRQGVLRQG